MEKEFITKDSGERIKFPSGFNRDTNKGKPRYDLVPLAMLTRWAALMARGAEKYGDDNWKKAESDVEVNRFRESAFRHFVQWMSGEKDEDHAAAVFFNIAAWEYHSSRLNKPRAEDFKFLYGEPWGMMSPGMITYVKKN